MKALKIGLTVSLTALGLAGCVTHSVGPRTVPATGFDYNEAISRTWDEQLLLNLVRLRYRDSPLFVDINSMTASYSLGRSASVSAEASGNSLNLAKIGAGAGISFSDNPVISYSYLHGDEFAQRLLSPLAPADLRVLARTGWSVERLMLCCYQSFNEIENAVGATGPTPDYVPEYERFQRVAVLLRELQLSHHVTWEYEGDSAYLRILPGAKEIAAELRNILGLPGELDRFELVPPFRPHSSTQIAVQGRSLLGVMYFLSLAIDIPADHLAAGKVTRTRDLDGKDFDWARIVGPLMHIRSGAAEPNETAVKVNYRGYWFWIDDNDLNSKSSFSLVRLLLFLKSGSNNGPSPLVTIPSR